MEAKVASGKVSKCYSNEVNSVEVKMKDDFKLITGTFSDPMISATDSLENFVGLFCRYGF